MKMRDTLLEAFKEYARGNIAKHKANVEVYLKNPTGIGEHSDIIEAIEQEVKAIAEYDDLIEASEKYFE